jgi:hypothetical protein
MAYINSSGEIVNKRERGFYEYILEGAAFVLGFFQSLFASLRSDSSQAQSTYGTGEGRPTQRRPMGGFKSTRECKSIVSRFHPQCGAILIHMWSLVNSCPTGCGNCG